MSRVRPLVAHLALASAIFLACLGTLEGLARWREARAPGSTRLAPEPDLPAWSRPGSAGAAVFRGRQRSLEPPPGWRRVAVLGDSVTYGYDVPAELAYPRQVEALFEQQGQRVEVLNAAWPGWSTRDERMAWQGLRAYRPERVVLAVCLNDLPALDQAGRPAPAWLRWLHGRAALVRRLVDAPRRELRSVRQMFVEPDAPEVARALGAFERELSALRRAVEADGGSLALVLFPYRFQFLPGAPAPSVQERLRRVAEGQGLACLDLLPALQELGPAGYQDVCHLSPPGLARVAQAIVASDLLGPHTR